MSAVQWEQLREWYKTWQQRNLAPLAESPVDALGYTVQQFAELLQFVQHQSQTPWPLGERDLAIALAICIVEPDSRLTQAETAWQTLCTLTQPILDEPAHWLEIVIARGCGWGRTVQPGAEEVWERRWTNAIFAFCSLVERSVYYTVKRIAQRLTQSGEVRDLFQVKTEQEVKERVRAYAELIALEVIHNRCSCSLPSASAQPDCGQAAHQLSFWRASECSLSAFIAQAVRGRATPELLVGAFIRSTLYPLLRDDIHLLADQVEFKRCPACGTLYEANHCPNPTCLLTAAASHSPYRLARKNWLLIPYEHGGNYLMVQRWRCRQCDTLFPLNLTSCPQDGGPRSQRPTNVWIYIGNSSTGEDEVDDDSISGGDEQ